MKNLKLFGERNTNTNYLSKLIALNLSASEMRGVVPDAIIKSQAALPGKEWLNDLYFGLTEEDNLGWKHARILPFNKAQQQNVEDKKVGFVSVTKNPYSWLLSLYKRPYHDFNGKVDCFEDFLNAPWLTVKRDNCQSVLKSPVELWNIKNRSYDLLAEYSYLQLRSEDVFESPEGVIDRISNDLEVDRLNDDFVNYTRSTKDKSKDFAYYRDYYLNEEWRTLLSDSAVEIINESVDQSLMDRFGYATIS
ncbi:hypothetical protein [Amphritea sp. HPY]|uniref:hypothetical protein n=1 Tax=Amphritea sp. HPY TaxID=3421652 RepID=UPI003D7C4DF7